MSRWRSVASATKGACYDRRAARLRPPLRPAVTARRPGPLRRRLPLLRGREAAHESVHAGVSQLAEQGGEEAMSKPRLLDLFCGAGGAARGYQEAGFYVVCVD